MHRWWSIVIVGSCEVVEHVICGPLWDGHGHCHLTASMKAAIIVVVGIWDHVSRGKRRHTRKGWAMQSLHSC